MGRREHKMDPKKMEFPLFFTCKKRRTRRYPLENFLMLSETACSEAKPVPLPHPTPNNQGEESREEEREMRMTNEKGDKEDMGHIKKEKTDKGKEILHITRPKKLPKVVVKKKRKAGENETQPAPHSWLVHHHRMMVFKKDPGLIHVCEKRLQKTDVDRGQNRLLLPTKDVRGRLLPALGFSLRDEGGILETPGIEVVGLDPMGREWKLNWKFWTKYHVLDGQWKNLVEVNGLQAGLHTLHVSAFCYGEDNCNICFVMDTQSCLASSSSSSPSPPLSRRASNAELTRRIEEQQQEEENKLN